MPGRERETTKLNENSDVMLPWGKAWLRHKTKTVISRSALKIPTPGHRNAPYKIFETLNEMSTLIKLNSPRIPTFSLTMLTKRYRDGTEMTPPRSR